MSENEKFRPFGDAIQYWPFSNGTEGTTWMNNWCDFCTRDHACHDPNGDHSQGCDLILGSLVTRAPNEEYPWPKEWLPEPDDGIFCLPSRLTCLAFSPCVEGVCADKPGTADPYAEIRAIQTEDVANYWRADD